MKRLHLILASAFVMLLLTIQVNAQTLQKEIANYDDAKNTELLTSSDEAVALKSYEPEALNAGDPSINKNIILDVRQAKTGQNLAINSTKDVGEYGSNDDYSLYLLLCLLLGVPVIVVIS